MTNIFKVRHRALAFILTIAMLVGMVPSMNMAVAAAQTDNLQMTKTAYADTRDGADERDFWIELGVTGHDVETPSQPLYVVLLLDVSVSMKSSSMTAMKSGAASFVSDILEQNSANRVAVVPFSGNAYTSNPWNRWSNSKNTLVNSINGLNRDGNTDTTDAINKANALLNSSSVPSNAKTVAVLFSDGVPYDGGDYSYTHVQNAVSAMNTLKTGHATTDVYTIYLQGNSGDDYYTEIPNNKVGGSGPNRYITDYPNVRVYGSRNDYYAYDKDLGPAVLAGMASSSDKALSSATDAALQGVFDGLIGSIFNFATDATITDVLADDFYMDVNYADDIQWRQKVSSGTENAWQDMSDTQSGDAPWYEIADDQNVSLHFPGVMSEPGVEVRFKIRAYDEVYSSASASAANPDLPTNLDQGSVKGAKIEYTNINEQAATKYAATPYVYIPDTTPPKPVEPGLSKTAEPVPGYDDPASPYYRNYEITLDAYTDGSISTYSVSQDVDVLMVLDVSGSMEDSYTKEPVINYDYLNEDTNYRIYMSNQEDGIPNTSGQGANVRYLDSKPSYSYDGGYVSPGWYYWKKTSGGIISAKYTYYPVEPSDTNDPDNGEYVFHTTERRQGLLDATVGFVKGLSDNSRVAITTYSSNLVDSTGEFLTPDEALDYLVDYNKADGSTYMYYGLKEAVDIFNDAADTEAGRRPRYVIAFTDGDDYDKDAARLEAKLLKGDPEGTAVTDGIDPVAKVYTIDFEGDNQTFLKDIASTPDSKYYKSAKGANLNDIFNKVIEDISGGLENVNVRDYINPRFIVVDENGDPLPSGSKIYTESGEEGVLHIQAGTNGKTYIEWENQNIPAVLEGEDTPHWTVTFRVKAKDDFIGGNDVYTNTSQSGVFTGDPSGDDLPEYPFEMPQVNVPIAFEVGNEETTIFYGETVPEELEGVEVESRMMDESEWKFYGDATGVFSYQWVNALDEEIADLGSLEPYAPTNVYTLKVTFTPNPCAVDSEAVGTEQTAVTEEGDYTVHVVRGSIQVTKNLSEDEIWYANGDPIFTFKLEKLEGNQVTATQYRTVRFTEGGQDGSLTATFEDLKKGEYRVTEMDSLRHQYVTCGVGAGDKASSFKDGSSVKAYMGYTTATDSTTDLTKDFGDVFFTNEEKQLEENYFSHTDTTTNYFRITFTGDNDTMNPDGSPVTAGSSARVMQFAMLPPQDDEDPISSGDDGSGDAGAK